MPGTHLPGPAVDAGDIESNASSLELSHASRELHKSKFHPQENYRISKRYAFLITIFDSFEAIK